MFRVLLFLAFLLPIAAHAQSTAQRSTLGYDQTGNCPGGEPTCWTPFVWQPMVAGALSTTVTAITGEPGQLALLQCYNPNSSVAYVQIFNATPGNVTLGTTAPALSVAIGPTAPGGFALPAPGVTFSTAISFAATTTYDGSTAPSTALTCNVGFN